MRSTLGVLILFTMAMVTADAGLWYVAYRVAWMMSGVTSKILIGLIMATTILFAFMATFVVPIYSVYCIRRKKIPFFYWVNVGDRVLDTDGSEVTSFDGKEGFVSYFDDVFWNPAIKKRRVLERRHQTLSKNLKAFCHQ